MKKLVFIAATIIPLNAIAAGYSTVSTVTGFSSINNTGAFELYGNFGDPDNCTSGGTVDKYIVGQHSTDDDLSRQSKFAMISSAYMGGKTIELYVDGCSGVAPIVKGIYLPNR